MPPSRRHCLWAFLALLNCSLSAPRSHAESLTITSSPAGASVEIDGQVTGTTPYKTDFPGGYFHKTHTVFESRLDHSLVARISMEGYLSQQVTMTQGPFEWVAVTGRHHGSYFLLKSDRFNIKLEPVLNGGNRVETIGRDGPMPPASVSLSRVEAVDKHVQSGIVSIVSDSPGADIYVDGKFVGQTPSTIQLSSGLHRVEVKSEGKHDWTRNLDVTADSELTLHPVLSSSP